MMKHLFLTTFVLFSSLLCMAQNNDQKKVEHSIMLGSGLFLESGYSAQEQNPGAMVGLSYGLDIRLHQNWSVMPGVGLRGQMGKVFNLGAKGGMHDGMGMADVFCVVRYHFNNDKIILALGPAISYIAVPSIYAFDASPNNPLNGKEKSSRFDASLRPSIVFRPGAHFQWGLEAGIGLMNTLQQYPEYNVSGSLHLHYLALTCGWRF